MNPIRAGLATTPEASDFTSIQQRIAEWKQRQAQAALTPDSPPPAAADNQTNLDESIVKLLGFSGDSNQCPDKGIPSSTADYLELVDWSGRAIVEGKKGAIPEHLPPILQRLNMRPEQYLAYIRKLKSGFAHALGALDKLKEYAEYFEKAFIKGQTAAAALFSPGR